MALAFQSASGYSSAVTARLLVGDVEFDVWKTGPDELYLKDPVDLPPTEGTLIITVDSKESRYLLSLPDGARRTEPRISVVNLSRRALKTGA